MTDKEPLLDRYVSIENSLNSLALTNKLNSEGLYLSLDEGERIIYHALFDPIKLPDDQLSINPLSPTAGDPDMIKIGDLGYEKVSFMYMQSKFDDAGSRISNTDEAELEVLMAGLYAMQDEVVVRHERQCFRNDESIVRLKLAFVSDPSAFDPGMGEIIYRVRSGEATSEDRIRLLAAHPEMISIEDMKFTCPLDTKSYKKVMMAYFENFLELQHRSNISYIAVPIEDQCVVMKETRTSSDPDILVTKVVIGEVFIDGFTLELVERRSHYAFRTIPQLRGVIEVISNGPDGTPFNLQPIAVSAYFRVKENGNTEVNESAREVRRKDFDSTLPYIVIGGVRRHLDDLRVRD
ncbi:MAG TPA: hypothetical protein PK543_03080 [Candidatus Saccharibacteria bacterium]|nr:hypothetical protein [Candidatus Saccharibacteria bacterium]